MMSGYYRSIGDNIEFRSKARGARRFNVPQYLVSSSARGLSDFCFFPASCRAEEPVPHHRRAGRTYRGGQSSPAGAIGGATGEDWTEDTAAPPHSDYFVKEIDNLVKLSGAFEGKEEVVERLKYEGDDGIAPDRIRVYVAKESGLTRCVVDEFGIDMPVFDETIDWINRVTNELASRLAEDAET